MAVRVQETIALGLRPAITQHQHSEHISSQNLKAKHFFYTTVVSGHGGCIPPLLDSKGGRMLKNICVPSIWYIHGPQAVVTSPMPVIAASLCLRVAVL